MRLLFLHGAGGYDDDRPLADALALALAAELVLPRLPGDDLSYEGWARPIRGAIAGLDSGDAVVAHSFGASMLLNVLTERRVPVRRVLVLAMPDWGPDGWDVPDYAFNGPEPAVGLSLHHCRDDDIVPIEHLAAHAVRLRRSFRHEHPTGGHQFEGALAPIIADLRAGSWPPSERG